MQFLKDLLLSIKMAAIGDPSLDLYFEYGGRKIGLIKGIDYEVPKSEKNTGSFKAYGVVLKESYIGAVFSKINEDCKVHPKNQKTPINVLVEHEGRLIFVFRNCWMKNGIKTKKKGSYHRVQLSRWEYESSENMVTFCY